MDKSEIVIKKHLDAWKHFTMCRCTTALSSFVLLCGLVPALCTTPSDPCVSLEGSPFEVCMKAGYDKTVRFPEDFTRMLQQEVALEMKSLFKQVKNCSTDGLAETIECSFVAPKCNSLGEPVYPCKQVCAEFLKQCELELPDFTLDFYISSCLVLSNGSSSCNQCYTPPNFSTNASQPGPLDRGCQELIIPACKNLGAYNNTLISVPAQEELYLWFYAKDYAEDSAETDFPEIARKMFEQYPTCQENIKKLFCGEYLPPCFPDEDPHLYSLCQPLCDQIATDCPGFFSHDLMSAEFCSTMARGQTKHGYCQSTDWPAAFNWVRYMEATMSPSAVPESNGLKAWSIILAVLLPLLIVGIVVGLVVARVFWRKKRGGAGVAYSNYYKKQSHDILPLEIDADVDSSTV